VRLITQVEFARLAGVSTSSITKAIESGGELCEALVGTSIDIESPAAAAYIERRVAHHFDPDFTAPHITRADSPKAKIEEYYEGKSPEEIRREELDALAEDIRALADMSLAELVFHFGSDERFLAWLKSIDQIEKIEGRRIRNCVANGELVKRELVHVGIFMPLDAAFRGLLSDGAKNISTKVAAMVRAGCEQVETEEYVAEVLGSYLNTARAKMQRCLSSLK